MWLPGTMSVMAPAGPPPYQTNVIKIRINEMLIWVKSIDVSRRQPCTVAHYYAMELIDGPSLHEVIRSLRSGDRKSAKVSGSAATKSLVRPRARLAFSPESSSSSTTSSRAGWNKSS